MRKLLTSALLILFITSVSYSQDKQMNFNVRLKKESSNIPDSSNLSKYPNPFCPATDLKFNIKEKSSVKIKLYDAKMDFIATLIDEELEAGKYEIHWEAATLKSGVYYYELTAGGVMDTQKLVLVK